MEWKSLNNFDPKYTKVMEMDPIRTEIEANNNIVAGGIPSSSTYFGKLGAVI